MHYIILKNNCFSSHHATLPLLFTTHPPSDSQIAEVEEVVRLLNEKVSVMSSTSRATTAW
jgi:hypothetical protein